MIFGPEVSAMMPFQPPPPDPNEQAFNPKAESPDAPDGVAGRRVIVSTGNKIPGYRIRRCLGIVRGIVVRSPSIGQGFAGALQQIVGGNIEVYARVCEAARQDAFERMTDHAAELGADGIIAMRYDATEFSDGVTEVLAYGTAVKLARKEPKSAAQRHGE